MDSTKNSAQPTIPLARRIVYALIPMLFVYLAAEAVLTFLWMRGTLDPISTWIYEDNGTGSSYRFDPVLGFAISQVPARMASTVTDGTIESVGTIRGNNLGFPDADDFTPERDDSGRLRLAIFGDSFTAGQYAPTNWPAEAEQADVELDLMNLAIDGGGMTNWSSVMTKLLVAENYDLDGVVFAVYGDDLHRGFSLCDDSGDTLLFGTVPTTVRATPSSLDQARTFMKKLDRWERVSSERFDALLEGAWHPRAGRSFSPFLFDRMARLLGLRSSKEQWHIRPIEDAHYALMQDIERAARQANLPLLVVYIPSIEEVRGGTNPVGDPEQVRDFAKRIGASFLDGTAAFEKLDNDVLEACWLAVDGHFSQTGMRHFGAYMGPALVEWIHGDHAPAS